MQVVVVVGVKTAGPYINESKPVGATAANVEF